MRYCPYTNSAPPACTINRIIKINDELKKYISEALKSESRKFHAGFSDQAASSGDLTVTILSEDRDSITVRLEASAGYWSFGYDVEMEFTIPKEMLEKQKQHPTTAKASE